MGFIVMILTLPLLLVVLAASIFFIFRDRLLHLAARIVGVSAFGVEQLSWRGCRRLRLVLAKGPVQCIQLDSAELQLPAAGRSIASALWLLLRLMLAAVDRKWARGNRDRRPLALLRLQGLELELRASAVKSKAKTSLVGGAASGSGSAAVAAARDWSESEGGSTDQAPSLRNSSSGDGGGNGSGGGGGGFVAVTGAFGRWRRRNRGGGGRNGAVIALPAPVLWLLAMVHLELRDGRVRAVTSPGDPKVMDGETPTGHQTAVVGGDAAITEAMCEIHIAYLAVTASQQRDRDGSGDNVEEDGENGGGGGAGEDGGCGDGGRTGGRAAGAAPRNAASGGKPETGRLTEGGADVVTATVAAKGAAAGAGQPSEVPTAKSPSQPQRPLRTTTSVVVVSLNGVEAVLRRQEPAVAEAAASLATAASAAAPTRAALLTGRCSGLAVTTTFGRGRRPDSTPGILRAVAMDMKEVLVDCHAVLPPGRAVGFCVDGADGGGGPETAVAGTAAAAAVADSPLAAALMAVLTTAMVRGRSTSARKRERGSRADERQQQQKEKTQSRSVRVGDPLDLNPELSEHVAARIRETCRLLPEKVSLRLAGVRAAATVTTTAAAAVMAAAAGSGGRRRGDAASASATDPAAAVQFLLGASSLDVGVSGGGVSNGPGEDTSSAKNARICLDASVQLGPVAALGSAGPPAASAAAAPLYFGMQHLGIRGRVEAVPSTAAMLAPQRPDGCNSGSSSSARTRWNSSLTADVDVPATVLQVRPEMLLRSAKACTAGAGGDTGRGGVGGGGGGGGATAPLASSPPRPAAAQPTCYSLLLRGIAAKASCGLSALESRTASPLLPAVHCGNAGGRPQDERGLPSARAALPSVLRPSLFRCPKQLKGGLPRTPKAVRALAAATSAAAAEPPVSADGDRRAVARLQAAPLEAVLETSGSRGEFLQGQVLGNLSTAAARTALKRSEALTVSQWAVHGLGPSPEGPAEEAGSAAAAAAAPEAASAPGASTASTLSEELCKSLLPPPPPSPSGLPMPPASAYGGDVVDKVKDILGVEAVPPPSTVAAAEPAVAAAAGAAVVIAQEGGRRNVAVGPYGKSAAASAGAMGVGKQMTAGTNAAASLALSLQGLELYGTRSNAAAAAAGVANAAASTAPAASMAAGGAAADFAATAAATAAAAAPGLAAHAAHGGRYDILLLQHSTFSMGLAATIPPAAEPTATAAKRVSPAQSNVMSMMDQGVPSADSSAVAIADLAVALGHLDVVLDPWQLTPLLRLAGHLKAAAAAAAVGAAATAAAAAAAAQAKSATASGGGAQLQEPLVSAAAAFTFPVDVISPETLPAFVGADAARVTGRTDGDGVEEFNGDSGRHGREKRRGSGGGGLATWLKVRNLTLDSATGIRVALHAEMPLDAMFRAGHAGPAEATAAAAAVDAAATTPGIQTTLEAIVATAHVAVWPGDGTATADESSVVEASANGISVAVVRAAAAAAVPPAAAAVAAAFTQAEQQQVLRIERAKVLTVLTASAASAAAAAAAAAARLAADPATAPAASAGTAPAVVAPHAQLQVAERPSLRDNGSSASGDGASGGISSAGVSATRDLVRVQVSGTRGSADVDMALVALAAAQALADAAAAARREERRQLVPVSQAWLAAAAAADSAPPPPLPPALEGFAGAAAALNGRPQPQPHRVSARRRSPLVEVRATDTEFAMSLGAAEVVSVAAAEMQGSSSLAKAAVEALAVRVNGRRLLDVEHLTVGAVEPFAPAKPAPAPPASSGAGSGAGESRFTAAAAVAASATPGSRGSPVTAGWEFRSGGGGGGGGGSRQVSGGSADMFGLSGEAVPSLPPSQQPHRRHHRRHGSCPTGSVHSPTVVLVPVRGPATAAAATQPPPRPAAATLRPWVALGLPPAAAAAAASVRPGMFSTAGGPPAGAAATPGPSSKRPVVTTPAKCTLARGAASEARRRAARERFDSSQEAGAGIGGGGGGGRVGVSDGGGVISMDMALYGATLTVSYDESAARVYVVTEIWLRAVRQVLEPRVARLTDTLRNLIKTPTAGLWRDNDDNNKDKDTSLSWGPMKVPTAPQHSGTAATHVSAGDGGGDGGGGGGGSVPVTACAAAPVSRQPDKAFVEILLDARQLAVVVEHQPLEAWLALHGSALRATATQCSLYDRLLKGHVGSCAARGRADVAAAVEGARRAVLGPVSGSSSSMSTISHSSSSDDGRSSDGRSRDGSDDDDNNDDDGQAAAGEAAPAAFGAGGDAAAASSGGGDVQDAWAQVMCDVTACYMAACRTVQAAALAAAAGGGAIHGGGGGGGGSGSGSAGLLAGCPGGALLHFSVAEAQAAVMVAPPGCSRGRQLAEAAIVRVDSPASEGVHFEQVVGVSLAAAAAGLQACLAGGGVGPSSPVLTCGQAAVSGWIIRARQLAAPPRTAVARWPVGRYHSAPVAMPLRFCRPNMKTYTDLRVEMDEVSAAFGTAMEPVLAQLAKAFKQRVVPPQPQLVQPNGQLAPQQSGAGGVRSASGLPPWDNIRYVWRGGMKVMIRGLNAVVAAPPSLELPITSHDPRVALSAATLGVKLSSGWVDVTATALAVLGFARGPGRGPGEPLVTVPLMSLPLLKTALHTAFKQRSPTPYAFPLLTAPPPEGAVQEPVDVPGLMQSTSWSLALEIALPGDAVTCLATHNVPTSTPTATSIATSMPGGGQLPPALWPSVQPHLLAPSLMPSGQQQLQQLQRHYDAATGALTPRQQQQQQQPVVLTGGIEGVARAYIGEIQVKFILSLVQGLSSGAPVMTRGSWKRHTHFEPPRPPPPPSASPSLSPSVTATPAATTGASSAGSAAVFAVTEAGRGSQLGGVGGGGVGNGGGGGGAAAVNLGLLLSRVDINLTGDVFDVVHDAQDPDDPSDLVCLRARNLRYANTFGYSRAVCTTMRSNGTPRFKLMARPVMTALSVEAYDIRIFMPPSGGGGGGGGSAAAAGPAAAGMGMPLHPPVAATGPAAAAGQRRQLGFGGAGRGPASESGPAGGDSWEGADPVAGPGFGTGLFATCECLRLRQAEPEDGPVEVSQLPQSQQPQQQPQQLQQQPNRALRIVVRNVQVLCTIDSRDAVIATTMHIIEAFSRLPGSAATRAAATAASAAPAGAAAAAAAAAAGAGPNTGRGAPGATAPGGAQMGGGQGPVVRHQYAGHVAEHLRISDDGGGDGTASAAGLQGKVAIAPAAAAAAPLPPPLTLRPAPSLRLDAGSVAEPYVDPGVIAKERALVALLRAQNEERRKRAAQGRAEADRRRQERAGYPFSGALAAFGGGDPDQAGSLYSYSEDEGGMLGSSLDPSDMLPKCDLDLESEAGRLASADVHSAEHQQHQQRPAMQTLYEVEFVLVQVVLVSESGSGGAYLVLGADSALLRGGRKPATAATSAAAAPKAAAAAAATAATATAAAVRTGPGPGPGPGSGALKVLTFDVETLQAYAARQEQPREAGQLAPAAGGAGGSGGVRPSFSPLTDALAANAAATAAAAAAPPVAAIAATGAGGGGFPQRPAEAAASAAAAGAGGSGGVGGVYGTGVSAPPVWLQVVNGQLVPPYSTAKQPATRAIAVAAAGGGGGAGGGSSSSAATAAAEGTGGAVVTAAAAGSELPNGGGSRIIMQKILNPFRVHLKSSCPLMPLPTSVNVPAAAAAPLAPPPPPSSPQPPPQQRQHPQPHPQPQRLQPPGGRGGALDDGGGGGGLALDIDVTAITGQMESWQFQLLMAVIQDSLASPLPKVVMLTRGSGGEALPYVESDPQLALIIGPLLDMKQRLRCLQQEALTLASYLTRGAPDFYGLFRPPPLPPTAIVRTGGGGGGSGAAADAVGAVGFGGYGMEVAIPPAALAQALLAPRPAVLNAVQLAALLRRNQELLLHWVLEQVAGAQTSLEKVASAVVRLRAEVAEAQRHKRRKQATTVAVKLGRFGWALTNKEGAPFVQAELTELSFHHSLGPDRTGKTKIVMCTVDMWELTAGAPPAAGSSSGSGTSTGAGAGVAGGGGCRGGGDVGDTGSAGQAGQSTPMPPPPAAAAAAVTATVESTAVESSELSIHSGGGGGAATGATAGGSGAGGSTSSSSILSRWRPDASSSWDDEPVLQMHVVHGGVDAQYVTYEHIEVYLQPLQIRLEYALGLVLADYFGVRDDDREDGGGKDEAGSKGAGRREKSKGSGAVKGAESSAAGSGAASGGGSTYSSPVKTGRGGWLKRRNATALPETAAATQAAAPVAGGGPQPPGPVPAAVLLSGSADPGSRTAGAALPDPRQQQQQQIAQTMAAADQLMAPLGAIAVVASSPLRGKILAASAQPEAYVGTAAVAPQGRHSRGPSAVAEEPSAAAAVAHMAAPQAIDGAAVAAAFPASTMAAVRYGPIFRRRSDGSSMILVDVAGTLVPTVPPQTAQQPALQTGRGTRQQQQHAAASGGDGVGGEAPSSQAAGGRSGGRPARAPRRLRFRYVRFNRMAARVTYTGPMLSIGGTSGRGLVIDARVYQNVVGGWRDILSKYKWDVIRSVIKSITGIQAGKLKELRGGVGGGGLSALLLGGGGGGDAILFHGGLLAAGLSLEDLDPDITYTTTGNSLSAVTGSVGGAAGGPGVGVSGGRGSGGHRAALIGSLKKRTAAVMSAGGVAGGWMRQVASRQLGRTTVGGGTGQFAGVAGPLERALAVSPEEVELAGEDAEQGPGKVETSDVLRMIEQQDTAQECERIKRAAAAAQARMTRLNTLLGNASASEAGSGTGFMGGMAAGGGGRGKAALGF